MIGLGFADTMRGSYLLAPRRSHRRARHRVHVQVRVSGIRKFAKDGEYRERRARRRPRGQSSSRRHARPEGRKRAAAAVRLHVHRDDGAAYRFRGQKDVMLIALADTMTTLPASLYEAKAATRSGARRSVSTCAAISAASCALSGLGSRSRATISRSLLERRHARAYSPAQTASHRSPHIQPRSSRNSRRSRPRDRRTCAQPDYDNWPSRETTRKFS